MASSKPNTVLTKLLKCQQIIGYNFRDISLLQESLSTGRNRRLATAGDTYVQVALVDRWFPISKNTSADFDTIRKETVSNFNLARVGFRRGLGACALPVALSESQEYAMADTVEALLGAVYRDAMFDNGERSAEAANWAVFEGVIARLGINHNLIASASDLRWSLNPIKTKRTLMRQFFSGGHHLELAKLIAETSSNFNSIKFDDSPTTLCSSKLGSLEDGDITSGVLSSSGSRSPNVVPSDDNTKKKEAPSKEQQTNLTSDSSQPKAKVLKSRAAKKKRRLEAKRADKQSAAWKLAKETKRSKARKALRKATAKATAKARKLAASKKSPTESHEL